MMRRLIFWTGVGVAFVTAVLASAFIAWMLAGAVHGNSGAMSTRFFISLVIFVIGVTAAVFTRPQTSPSE